MKLCPRCGKDSGRSNTRNGSYCKSCRNEVCDKRNDHRTHEIRTYLKAKKTGAPCTDCGLSYPHFVMDYDHVRGKKTGLISMAASRHWNFKRLDEELAKCDLVCANCHRIRTFTRAVRLMDKPSHFECETESSNLSRPSKVYVGDSSNCQDIPLLPEAM